jgi:salicylate hydroxylase
LIELSNYPTVGGVPIHVLVAGGGIGGLALAHGLHRAGVSVAVYERDASPLVRRQGYRIHIDADGGAALRHCLPDPLFRLYLATSNRASSTPRISGVDHRLRELFAMDVGDPDADPATAHTAVNRQTLRQILLTGLDGIVRYGHEVAGADQDGHGVTLHFAGGGTARGDVLVAADGVGSVLRDRILPQAAPVDTGVRVVYGRTTLTPERLGWIPERFFHGFTSVVGPGGRSMAVGAMRQRRPVAEATAELVPGAPIDPFADYLMWAMVAPGPEFPLDDEALLRAAPDALAQIALDLADGWHPALRRVIAEADIPSCFPIAVRTCLEVPEPPAGAVTLLGDAIHPMTPAAGAGANTALRDAALLTDQLAAVDAGEQDTGAALGSYAEQMRRYATAAVRLSLRNAQLEHLLP